MSQLHEDYREVFSLLMNATAQFIKCGCSAAENPQEIPGFPQNPQENLGEFRENSLEEKVKEKRKEKESESKGEGEREAARSAASADAGARELSIDETTERVAAILKLDISQALFRIVKDFYYRTDIDLITQAELAREWADTKAQKPVKMSASIFLHWMEREVRFLPNSNNLTEEELQRRAEMEAYEASCEAQL